MSAFLWITTLLVVAAASFFIWRSKQRVCGQPPVVKKSKYAAISSREQAPASSSASANTTGPTTPAAASSGKQLTTTDFTIAKTYQLMWTQIHQGRISLPPAVLDLIGLSGNLSDASSSSPFAKLSQRFAAYDCFDQTLPSLERFKHIQYQTHCVFARKSRVCGSPSIDALSRSGSLPSVSEQTLAAVPGFVDFTMRVKASYPTLKDLGPDFTAPSLDPSDPSSFFTADTRTLLEWPTKLSEFQLDAFVIEVGGGHGGTLESFANAIKDVLKTLSRCDPVTVSEGWDDQDSNGLDITAAQALAAVDTSSASSVFSSSRWHFTFLQETFFVTCFAPCYPRHSARYMFAEELAREKGAAAGKEFEEKCYVLFQPELSFLRHNLSPDTKDTNWLAPKTERDRIRVAFKKAERPYPIPPSVAYPAAEFIVPPTEPFSGQVVKWWEY